MSVQTDAPEAHDVRPVWHAFDEGTHLTFAAHGTHWPLAHTALVPHDVPFWTAVC